MQQKLAFLQERGVKTYTKSVKVYRYRKVYEDEQKFGSTSTSYTEVVSSLTLIPAPIDVLKKRFY